MTVPHLPNLPSAPPAIVKVVSSERLQPDRLDLVYNVPKPPHFQESQDLQAIVDEVVEFTADKGLPKQPLSITLIDVKSREFAGYQQQQLRYPASVVKLFWMVVLYAQIESGILPEDKTFSSDLYKMIKYSNNESASRIVDLITDTQSGTPLKAEQYKNWLQKRKQITEFFRVAGYENLNISQKVYPIPYLDLDMPKGRDLQIRENSDNPIRNLMTTSHVGRLLYEIFTGQAVSREASQQMAKLLSRDLRPEVWRNEGSGDVEMNPIAGLLGQFLPSNIYFASKAGETSNARHDATFVSTPDGKTSYILVVFGSSSSYADDEKILPQISRRVFNRMVARSSR